MKLTEIIEKYGNIDVPDRFLVLMGLKDEDMLIDAEEFTRLTGYKSPYQMIDRIKRENGLRYDGARLPKSLVKRIYHLE